MRSLSPLLHPHLPSAGYHRPFHIINIMFEILIYFFIPLLCTQIHKRQMDGYRLKTLPRVRSRKFSFKKMKGCVCVRVVKWLVQAHWKLTGSSGSLETFVNYFYIWIAMIMVFIVYMFFFPFLHNYNSL